MTLDSLGCDSAFVRWNNGIINEIDNIWKNEHNKSLDYIHVYNEYQDSGVVDLRTVLDRPSNLKKKFRIWRVNIPRHLNII